MGGTHTVRSRLDAVKSVALGTDVRKLELKGHHDKRAGQLDAVSHAFMQESQAKESASRFG